MTDSNPPTPTNINTVEYNPEHAKILQDLHQKVYTKDEVLSLLDTVSKRVIGDDTHPDDSELSRSKYHYRNQLREKQRKELNAIRKELEEGL
jgi:hypothetical protein